MTKDIPGLYRIQKNIWTGIKDIPAPYLETYMDCNERRT